MEIDEGRVRVRVVMVGPGGAAAGVVVGEGDRVRIDGLDENGVPRFEVLPAEPAGGRVDALPPAAGELVVGDRVRWESSTGWVTDPLNGRAGTVEGFEPVHHLGVDEMWVVWRPDGDEYTLTCDPDGLTRIVETPRGPVTPGKDGDHG